MSVFSTAKVVGVGTTEQARDLSHRTGMSLGLEALLLACADAGIDPHEIDGISSSISDWPYGPTPANGIPQEAYWATQLSRELRWLTPRHGVSAILDASMAIEHGLATTVAVVLGMSRQTRGDDTAEWTRPNDEFTGWTGSYTAVQFALAAQRYLHEHGEDALEAMAMASATIRNYGSINPDAVYAGRGPFRASDVLESRAIASPLTLLMCSTVNDGGAAVILTSAERSKNCASRPVSILAGADQQPYAPYVEAPVLRPVGDEGKFCRDALSRAGLAVDDVDVVELYDHFAIGVLLEFETFGFCGRGEAADFVRSGVMDLDGRYPTCTDGGNHSFSHNGLPSLFRPIEAVRQLRGQVSDPCTQAGLAAHTHLPGGCRAVRDPEVAFISNPGPPTGGGSFAVFGV